MIENELSGLSLPTDLRGRRPLSLGAAATVLLVLIGGVAGCGNPPAQPEAAASTTRTTATSTTSAAPTTTAAPTSSAAPSTAVAQPGVAPVPNRRAPIAATTTTRRAASTTTTKPAPKPAPKPAAAASDCDPNYSGCVPIASDVDCAGGSGNGPAYVRGPVRVTGADIYDLDRDGDGTACE